MINKVTLIGRLGADPELRHLENGTAVCKFSIATSENYKDKNDKWQQKTEWHTVIVWRDLAERVGKNAHKGGLVYVEGKITYRKYADKDNFDRYVTEIVADVVRALESKQEQEQDQPQQQAVPVQPKPNAVQVEIPIETDDLPF